jgi:hypothetical protein
MDRRRFFVASLLAAAVPRSSVAAQEDSETDSSDIGGYNGVLIAVGLQFDGFTDQMAEVANYPGGANVSDTNHLLSALSPFAIGDEMTYLLTKIAPAPGYEQSRDLFLKVARELTTAGELMRTGILSAEAKTIKAGSHHVERARSLIRKGIESMPTR